MLNLYNRGSIHLIVPPLCFFTAVVVPSVLPQSCHSLTLSLLCRNAPCVVLQDHCFSCSFVRAITTICFKLQQPVLLKSRYSCDIPVIKHTHTCILIGTNHYNRYRYSKIVYLYSFNTMGASVISAVLDKR